VYVPEAGTLMVTGASKLLITAAHIVFFGCFPNIFIEYTKSVFTTTEREKLPQLLPHAACAMNEIEEEVFAVIR